jgi:antitoxin (DNA-binding transcriptional repressor) of toxin-antitoxin stability system
VVSRSAYSGHATEVVRQRVAESDSIRYIGSVKTLSVTEVARNFSAVLDVVERNQEEIVLVRDARRIARLVPDASPQDAMQVFGDLYRTLDEETAEKLSTAVDSRRKSRRGRVSELRDPWAG